MLGMDMVYGYCHCHLCHVAILSYIIITRFDLRAHMELNLLQHNELLLYTNASKAKDRLHYVTMELDLLYVIQ